MNCLEFRRHLASEPHSRRVDFVAHREQCGRCAEAHAQALAFEDRLGHVLAVPAPDGLADRVLLRQSTVALRERRQGRRATAWRIAAVLALGRFKLPRTFEAMANLLLDDPKIEVRQAAARALLRASKPLLRSHQSCTTAERGAARRPSLERP